MKNIVVEVEYKYPATVNSLIEIYDGLTNEQAGQIAKRFIDNMENGDYTELKIKYHIAK